jgi:hypothetical protein
MTGLSTLLLIAGVRGGILVGRGTSLAASR